MSLSDWELWACANELIRQHGGDAGTEAAMKADKLLWEGDQEGSRTWRLILHRVNELLEPKGAALH